MPGQDGEDSAYYLTVGGFDRCVLKRTLPVSVLVLVLVLLPAILRELEMRPTQRWCRFAISVSMVNSSVLFPLDTGLVRGFPSVVFIPLYLPAMFSIVRV